MIECKFQPVVEFTCLPNRKSKLRLGRYHGSHFWDVPGFGRDQWVICGSLVGEQLSEALSKNKQSPEEILKESLEFLNQPLKTRKSKKKKVVKYRYGFLKPFKVFIRENSETKEKYLVVFLITTERTNKNFWNEGQVVT